MRRFLFGSLFSGCLLTLAAGCSSKAALVGAGGECQLATDCQNGLICIPAKNGTSTCSANLAGVQQLAPTPDAALPPLPSDDASASDEGGTGSTGDDAGGQGKMPEAGKTD